MSIRNAGEIAGGAVDAALKDERARIQKKVNKLKMEYRGNAIYAASQNWGESQRKYTYMMEACDDILTKLKEGR